MIRFLRRLLRQHITVSRVKDKRVSYDSEFRKTTLRLCVETGKPYPLRIPFNDNELLTIAEDR